MKPTRRTAGMVLVGATLVSLLGAAFASRDATDAPAALANPQSSADTPPRSLDDDSPQPTIELRAAPTVEVTFGSIDDWDGRPLTAFIGQQTPLLGDRVEFLSGLARQYGSQSTVAVQGTVELFDREIDPSWAYPVWAIALDPAAAAELLGPDVGNVLQRGELVLSRTAATLRKASVGTSLTLAGWDDPIKSLSAPVGAVVDDERTATAEMLMSTARAESLGLTRTWRVIVWGGDTKAVARDAAATVGSKYIDRSWTPKSVDSVLSPASLKLELGEFAVLRRRGIDPSTNGADIDSDPGWVKRNIVRADIALIGPINCHRQLVKPLQAVFAEIEQAGIAALINVADTRRAGGCWNPRLIRSANGTSGRNISRHSWGGALDINPSTNAYGATPTMDERIVDVFRRHGFAWGGTFPIADGMHFEYIGKPRVTGPALPPGTSTTTSTSTSTSTSTTSTSTTSTSTTTSSPATSSSTSSSTSTVGAATLGTTRPPTTVRPGVTTSSAVASTAPGPTAATVQQHSTQLPLVTTPATLPTSGAPNPDPTNTTSVPV